MFLIKSETEKVTDSAKTNVKKKKKFSELQHDWGDHTGEQAHEVNPFKCVKSKSCWKMMNMLFATYVKVWKYWGFIYI